MKRIRRPGIVLPTLKREGAGGIEAARREAEFQAHRTLALVNTRFKDHWGNSDVHQGS